jgi:hypothetical protein
MPPHTTPRQPLSCENCRKRKIKCQNSTGQVPCATCVRRGHSQSCFYKRTADFSQQGSGANESELLCRIRNLEDLLRQQLAQSSQSPPEHSLGSTPAQSRHAFSFANSDGTSLETHRTGTIITSPTGHQHFSPRAAMLGASFVPDLVESVPNPSANSGFPFSSESITATNTLLDILPPSSQCDELKSVFFEVFSPVSGRAPRLEHSDSPLAIPYSP